MTFGKDTFVVPSIPSLLSKDKRKLKKGSPAAKYLMMFLRNQKEVKKQKLKFSERAKRGWKHRRQHK